MASKIRNHHTYVAITPYTVEDSSADVFNELDVMTAYDDRRHYFYVCLHAGWATGYGGHGCILMGADDPLTAPKYVKLKDSPKNSQKTIDEMGAALEMAKDAIGWLFDKRDWQRLYAAVRNIALYGYTEQFKQQIEKLMQADKPKEEPKPVMQQVDVMGLMGALKTKGTAKLSDFAKPIENEEPKTEKEPNILVRYRELKKKHPDALLLFRTVNGYQFFCEDAKKAAPVLGLVLAYFRNDPDTAMCCFVREALDANLPKLVRAGFRVAICDSDETSNNDKNKEDETMRLNLNANRTNESVNVQAAAPVKVQEPAIEDAVVIEEIEDTVPAKPVAKPVDTKPEPEKPKRGADGKFAKKTETKAETKPAAKAGSYSVETYTTKKGGTAALLFGFASQEDAEKIANKMAKSIGSSWRWSADHKEKRYAISVGTRYVDVARELCDALNNGDKAAIDKACKDSVAIYEGVVADGKAAREAKRAEREAKAKPATAKAEPADDKERATYELFKKFLAGDKEAIAFVEKHAKKAA